MRKTQNYSKTAYVGDNRLITILTYTKDSYGSPVVNGKVRLRANPYTSSYGRNDSYSVFGNVKAAAYAPGINTTQQGPSLSFAQTAKTSAYNTAYARIRGKLYKGNANLGVTLGSYKQSRDMIVDRSKKIGDSAADMYYRLSKNPKLLRRVARRVARRKELGTDKESVSGAYLENIFGWQPLFQDIHAACETVIQLANQVEGVNGKGRSSFGNSYASGTISTMVHGEVRVTVAALVTIENPNLWLAERAGLLNPAAVGWDLVPWSFVVNMFTNLGQLVNSITDFVGLTFDKQSVTTCYKSVCSERRVSTNNTASPLYGGTISDSTLWRKERTVGSIPKPSFQFKMPEASWELAAIAVSLAVQRVKKLDYLLSTSLH